MVRKAFCSMRYILTVTTFFSELLKNLCVFQLAALYQTDFLLQEKQSSVSNFCALVIYHINDKSNAECI